MTVLHYRCSFRRAATVFRDPGHLSLYDEEHSGETEERWITVGIDSTGVLCVVVHTFGQVEEGWCRVRIISARKATTAEQGHYQAENP
jgi:uncharacterized DUF497 family protein